MSADLSHTSGAAIPVIPKSRAQAHATSAR